MSPKDARKLMVRRLMDEGVISSDRVARAMEAVERHLFLPAKLVDEAYIDTPLQIGEGQTISAPHMVAMMAEGLDLKPGLKVLEVGGGSGYHAAVMAELVKPDGRVYSMERIPSLAEGARRNLKAAGYDSMVEVIVGDGTKGLPEHAPFDRISIAAAAPYVPEPLKQQLADEGMMLIPVGGRWYQELTLVVRKGEKFIEKKLGGCVFVPLIGEYGFKD
ncbi:MAG: protein-L-isoaspartate(D-aspartate) O-methyltransferase [Methanomassiliicoccales archaeon]|nr:protein-L-isoaspartate(D-aspartate) O-methyltransferase [Methanomassiliicoccales archaeon]